MSTVFDLPLSQGSDFHASFNWYAGGLQRGIIEDIRNGYPTKIKATGHGLPSVSPTPIIIGDVEGLEQLNSAELAVPKAEYIDENYFYLNINTYGKGEWTPGTGIWTYCAPTDITDFTARATIRKRWHDKTPIHEMTTENGGISLQIADAAVNLYIPAATTMDFKFSHAHYDIEMISPAGAITRVMQGVIMNSLEMTQ